MHIHGVHWVHTKYGTFTLSTKKEKEDMGSANCFGTKLVGSFPYSNLPSEDGMSREVGLGSGQGNVKGRTRMRKGQQASSFINLRTITT